MSIAQPTPLPPVPMPVVITRNVSYSSSPGGVGFSVDLQPGELLVGIDWRQGNELDSITVVYASYFYELGQNIRKINVNAGSSGGTAYSYRSPNGQAMVDLGAWGSQYMQGLNPSSTTFPGQRGSALFLVGFSGQAGGYVDSIRTLSYRDFSIVVDLNASTDMQMACCMGASNANSIMCHNYLPQSGTCDTQVVQAYCSYNPKATQCACINEKQIPVPECFSIGCTTYGYHTAKMLSTAANCPNYMSCQQYLSISDDSKNNVLNNVTLTQTCSQNGNNNGNGTGGTTINTGPGNNNNTGNVSSMWKIVGYSALGLALLFLLLGFIF